MFSTPAKKRVQLYNNAVANLKEMEENMLKLLRHPEATAAHIERAREAYVHVQRSMLDVRHMLQNRHRESYFPWNKN